jgi:hypothetical protein
MSHVSPFYFSPRINNLIQKRSLQPLDKILAKRENRAFSTRGLNGDTAAKRRQNAAQGASLGQNAKDQQAPKGAKELLQPNSRTPCHSDRNRSERDGAAEEPASRVRHHKPYRLTYRGRAALQRRVSAPIDSGFSPGGRIRWRDFTTPLLRLSYTIVPLHFNQQATDSDSAMQLLSSRCTGRTLRINQHTWDTRRIP